MKKFFEELNALLKPSKRDIIEKDFHLHRLLHEIARNENLCKNLCFKGGTCLIKAYTGYYRFSEDIDFTWMDADIWKDKTKTETKRLCSTEIDNLLEEFKSLADNLHLDFKGEKRNTSQVHISSGGRMLLLFLGYYSEILERPERIKVEINFVDKNIYPYQNKMLQTYVKRIDNEEIRFIYTQLWQDYTTEIQLVCYDPREIFTEKCRAALTRKVYKLRDIIDIYILERDFGYIIHEYKKAIIDKTHFALEHYKRYQENIELLEFPTPDILKNEEMKLMIMPPPEDLSENIVRIHQELHQLRNELL